MLEGERRKIYVDVVARSRDDGRLIPLSVRLPDGREYQVVRVLGVASSAVAEAAVLTRRYDVVVEGKRTQIFLERDAREGERGVRWFVSARPERPRTSFGTGRA